MPAPTHALLDSDGVVVEMAASEFPMIPEGYTQVTVKTTTGMDDTKPLICVKGDVSPATSGTKRDAWVAMKTAGIKALIQDETTKVLAAERANSLSTADFTDDIAGYTTEIARLDAEIGKL